MNDITPNAPLTPADEESKPKIKIRVTGGVKHKHKGNKISYGARPSASSGASHSRTFDDLMKSTEKTANSTGNDRMRRSSWWGWTFLVSVGAGIAVLVIAYGNEQYYLGHTNYWGEHVGGHLQELIFIVWPVCALLRTAVNVKRCHDLGWTGWIGFFLVLLNIIPFVGWLPETICMGCLDGQPFANKYGPDPKGREIKDVKSQPSQPTQPCQATLGEQLRELKKLLDDGVLTQEEFASQKAKVLAGEGFLVATAEEKTPEKPIVKTSAIKAGTSVTMIPIPEKGYMICALPVTQALWVSVMGENPSHFKGEDYPVDSVSWDDCQAFLDKLNMRPKVKESGIITYRLPTAEEWEFACRADATGDYCMLSDGTEITTKTLGDVAWYASNSDGEPHPVGLKKPNAFGLYDMLGNVWEWTSTGVGSMKMFKGGAFNSSFALCKNSGLHNDNKGCNSDNRGFRLAADIVK